MKIISKIFWAIMQHITAPSEKEIRESLIGRLLTLLLIAFLQVAPAYSLPLTPDQVMVRADQELEDQFRQEVEELEVIFNDLALTDAKIGKTTHRLYLKGKYNEEAITLFVNNLAKANWDVYDNHATDIRVLKIVRHNTIPE